MNITVQPPVVPLAQARPLERVEAEIVALSSQLAAATARLLALIGEFDAAEGWRDWGMRSTAQWLSWKCGLGLVAAREQVRVARALTSLPATAAAFAAGRLSYSKVRALTRVANKENEDVLVSMGEHATGGQIERIVAASRRTIRVQEAHAQRRSRSLRVRIEDDGSVVGSFRLPPETGALFARALDVATGRLPASGGDELANASAEAQSEAAIGTARGKADALMLMATRILEDASAEAPADRADLFTVAVHATAEQLARPDNEDDPAPEGPTLDNGVRIHPATARRLSCDCPTYSIIDGIDGQAIHVGRRTRRIGARLRRAVHARDHNRCQAPGCTARARQIHHLRHWANGGTTCLRNLVSLCDHHHWLVHEGGWTLGIRGPATWVLVGPNGVKVTPHPDPAPEIEPLADDGRITADAVTGRWAGERVDLAACVDAVLAPPARRADPSLPEPPSKTPGASAEPAREGGLTLDALQAFWRLVDELGEVSRRISDDLDFDDSSGQQL